MRRMHAAAVIGLCFFSTAFAYDWSTNPGDGSAENPYQISTPEQMNSIGVTTSIWNKCFILMNDIDMSAYTGTQYKIIGTSYGSPFTGIFDGDGHKIYNLTYRTSESVYVGLFGYAKNATIKNLGVENANITTRGYRVGVFIGWQEAGTISYCYSTGSVVSSLFSNSDAGGLVGYQNSGVITNCYSTCSVTSTTTTSFSNSDAGGLVGCQYSGTITCCYSTGSVTSSSYAGGLVGKQDFLSSISNCYSTSLVTSLTNPFSSSSYAGGLVGWQWGTISHCYSTGSVTSDYCAGGLVGWQRAGTLIYCYSAGSVKTSGSGEKIIGGLIGNGGTIVNCFWDMQINGLNYITDSNGRTTAQMKQSANYIAWNTSTQTNWTIKGGIDYPRLSWQNQAGSPLPAQILSDYISGTGAISDPYRISTPKQLNIIGLFPGEWKKVFCLENDIDIGALTGTEFNLIGVNDEYPFSGTFEGNEYTIRNLTYTSVKAVIYIGLFGYTKNAIIQNLGVENVNISTKGQYAGVLVGWQESGTISRCYSTGLVTSSYCAGGLVGYQSEGAITYCYSKAMVTSESYSGGLVGRSSGAITHCYSAGDVKSLTAFNYYSTYAGGLVGYQYSGTITFCYSIGAVISNGSDRKFIGGLVGKGGNVVNSFWDIETSGLNNSAGGHGRTTAQLKQCANYIGWNAPTQTNWILDENVSYPRLVWENQQGVILGAQVFSDFIPGSGTSSNPYRISTPQQLNIIGLFTDTWNKVFRLEKDIDLGVFAGTEFNRIGVDYYSKYFSGTFDGNGHVIRNLTYTAINAVDYVGLFGCTKSATIKNLGIENTNLSTGGVYAGGIVGYQSDGTITHCYSAGTIVTTSSGSYVGGLVGKQYFSTITNCCSMGAVASYSTNSCAGGLVGYQFPGTITGCYSTSSVTIASSSYAGGLVGWQGSASNARIERCYSSGPVSATGSNVYQGGLLGYKDGIYGKVIACFWDTETSSLTTSAGGIGKTTAEMQALSTFTSAGWDFVNETTNGTQDIWFIREGKEYPRLVWEDQVPIADAGEGVTIYCEPNGFATIQLDGSASLDPDNDPLDYYWSWLIEDQAYAAQGVAPTIQLPLGSHEITLIVDDGIRKSVSDNVVVTVVGPLIVPMMASPFTLKLTTTSGYVMAMMDLPKGTTLSQLDMGNGFFLQPGDVKAYDVRCVQYGYARVMAIFEWNKLRSYLQPGRATLTMYGRLTRGQYVCGSTTLPVIN